MTPMNAAHLLAGLAIALVPVTASAYVDPNSGGLLFQILTPLMIGLLAFWSSLRNAVASQWRALLEKIRGLFRRT